jgi:hypothetical protein
MGMVILITTESIFPYKSGKEALVGVLAKLGGGEDVEAIMEQVSDTRRGRLGILVA